jgi:hypothetical protein
MKKSQIAENLIFILALNTSMFFTKYYQQRISGTHSAWDIVFDLLFIFIQALFFVIVFAQNKSLLSEGAFKLNGEISKRVLIFKYILIIVFKCALDAGIIFSANLPATYKYIVIDLLSLAYWLIAYAILVNKKATLWKNKRNGLIVLSIIVLSFGIGLCYDLNLANQTNLLNAKYMAESSYLVRACKNIDFLSSVKTFILDTAVICSLVIFHARCTPKTEEIQSTDTLKNGIQAFVRCDIILALILILSFTKMGFDPNGALEFEENDELSSAINYQEEGPFSTVLSNTQVRGSFPPVSDASRAEPYCFYYTETMTIYRDDSPVEKFTGNSHDPKFIVTDLGEEHVDYVKFLIDDHKVYLYGQYAICYYENGIPRIVRIDSLNECEENAIITELCKHLIENGNIFAFEYGCEYLLKYEKDFIEPYIERYAKGDFNTEESYWLTKADYRKEYIINIAKDYT